MNKIGQIHFFHSLVSKTSFFYKHYQRLETTKKQFLFLCGFLGFLFLILGFYYVTTGWGSVVLMMASASLGFFFKILLEGLRENNFSALLGSHQQAPYGVVFFDHQGKGYGANTQFYNLFEPTLSSTSLSSLSLGSFDAFLTNVESKEALARLKMCSLHQQEGQDFLELHLHKKILLTVVSVKPVSGRTVVWFIDVVSTSGKKNPSSELLLLTDVLQAYPSPALMISPEGLIIYTNDMFCLWLGYTPEKIFKKSLMDYLEETPTSWSEAGNATLVFKTSAGTMRAGAIVRVLTLNPEGDLCILIATANQIVAFRKEADDEALLEGLPLPGVLLDHRGYIKSTNHFFQEMVKERRLLQRPFVHWIEESERATFTAFLQQLRRQPETKQPLLVQFQGREEKTLGVYARYLSVSEDPTTHYFFLLFQDMTELKKMETQSLESQKLQALGQLASGITHDFNNLLTAMLGFCDLLLQRHTPQDQSFTDIMQIKQNANRATNLVRQLLLFARQSAPEPKPLDVKECVNELSFLLRRLIGAKIDLNIKHERDVGFIFADQGQLEQIIVNLSINARDAMPSGGKLSLRTRMVHLKDPLVAYKEVLKPRTYIVIDVADTGCGINQEHLAQIFDPFFSTKDPAHGTGLGLSNVYQILRQMDGGITIETHPNEGSVFSIYIARYIEKKKKAVDRKEGKEELPLSHPLPNIDLTGYAKILLVEDEDPVRLFASRALKSKGYQVYEARDGKRALEILESHSGINLLITDVIMPGIDGPSLVNQAYQFNPQIKVIFVSGYPQEEVQAQIHSPIKHLHFLPKPFSLNELAVKAHEVLNLPDPPPPPLERADKEPSLKIPKRRKIAI